MNSKKMLASTLVFVFTNFSLPAIIHHTESQPKNSNEERGNGESAPGVDLGAPRVIDMNHKAALEGTKSSKVTVRSVDFSHLLLADLKKCYFSFDTAALQISSSKYSSQKGAYVNLFPSDISTGLVQITNPQNALEKRLSSLLAHPEYFSIRGDVVSPQLTPKIITDCDSSSTLLTIEPWDFRLTPTAYYNQTSVQHMLVHAYSAFKGYVQIAKKLHPDEKVVVHTSFWGIENCNSSRMTTAIQLLAARLAGVDTLVFHVPSQPSENSSQAVFDAENFIIAQNGNTVAEIVQNMLQQAVHPEWAPQGVVAEHSSIVSDETIAAHDQ